MYIALIRSKAHYGSIIYSTAELSKLKHVETIQNNVWKIARGAFRTSSINSICCESSIAPLTVRRSQVTLLYIAQLVKNLNIPAFHHIFQTINNKITETQLSKFYNNFPYNLKHQFPYHCKEI